MQAACSICIKISLEHKKVFTLVTSSPKFSRLPHVSFVQINVGNSTKWRCGVQLMTCDCAFDQKCQKHRWEVTCFPTHTQPPKHLPPRQVVHFSQWVGPRHQSRHPNLQKLRINESDLNHLYPNQPFLGNGQEAWCYKPCWCFEGLEGGRYGELGRFFVGKVRQVHEKKEVG